MIEFKNVSKSFVTKGDVKQVLKEINLFIDEGDIYGCIGFSGAGKSTLLRCINRLEEIDSGEIIVDGTDIKSLSKDDFNHFKSNIGIIFQQFNLLKQKTVYQNIKIILEVCGYDKDKIDERVIEVLTFVELLDKKDQYPNNLSGGQQQRVGIARAIANMPKILLCDEPTSALDPITTKNILALLKKINKELNITVLIITHEMEVITEICNKVAIMDQGKIVEQNSVYDCFVNPQSVVTRNFVDKIISHDLPTQIANDIKLKDSHVYQLIFNSNTVEHAHITKAARKFGIDISILYGSIFEFQDYLIGSLIVELDCEPTQLELIIKYFNDCQVIVREV